MAKKSLKDIDAIAQTCSDCGNCLSACPIYQINRLEPSSPRGKVNLIKALYHGRLKPGRDNEKFIYQCLVCGSCQHACTKGVEFLPLMIEYRNLRARGTHIPLAKKIMLYLYQSPLFRGMARFLRMLAATSLKRVLPVEVGKDKSRFTRGDQGTVDFDILLFPGCVLSNLMPRFLEKIMKTFASRGFSCFIPKNLKCCGFPFLSQGWGRKFTELRDHNMAVISAHTFKYLVIPCGTGTQTFKEHYPLEGVEVLELSQFYYRFLSDLTVTAFPREKNQRVTFHHPCHTSKSLGIEAEPEYFLKKLNHRFISDQEKLCCGFGGLFRASNPALSSKILNRKREQLQDMDVDVVVTSCPGCYLQLKGRIPQQVRFFSDIF
jgi:glycolate oxidase iron-sulfur subunit